MTKSRTNMVVWGRVFGAVLLVIAIQQLIGQLMLRHNLSDADKAAEYAPIVMTVLSEIAMLKPVYEEFFARTGRLPATLAEVGISNTSIARDDMVLSLRMVEGAVLSVSPQGSQHFSTEFFFRPTVSLNKIDSVMTWKCFVTDAPPETARLLSDANCTAVARGDSIPRESDPEVTVDNLIAAVHARRYGHIKSLIARGVDVNAVSKRGEVALAACIEEADMAALQIVLAAGANVQRPIPRSNAQTPLIYTVTSGAAIQLAGALLSAGAHIDGRDLDGRTALIHAVMSDNVAIVEMLLNAGADLNDTDYSGASAIAYARRTGSSSRVLSWIQLRAAQNREFTYQLPE